MSFASSSNGSSSVASSPSPSSSSSSSSSFSSSSASITIGGGVIPARQQPHPSHLHGSRFEGAHPRHDCVRNRAHPQCPTREEVGLEGYQPSWGVGERSFDTVERRWLSDRRDTLFPKERPSPVSAAEPARSSVACGTSTIDALDPPMVECMGAGDGVSVDAASCAGAGAGMGVGTAAVGGAGPWTGMGGWGWVVG